MFLSAAGPNSWEEKRPAFLIGFTVFVSRLSLILEHQKRRNNNKVQLGQQNSFMGTKQDDCA